MTERYNKSMDQTARLRLKIDDDSRYVEVFFDSARLVISMLCRKKMKKYCAPLKTTAVSKQV